MIRARSSRTALLLAMLAATALTIGTAASAGAVTATKASFRGGQLRVEGRSAPGIHVIVESTTSAASARAGVDGTFKVQASGFSAPDCKVTLRDGRTADATVSLEGCTPNVTPAPAAPADPTGTCAIEPQPPANLTRGISGVVWFTTTGCDTTTNSGATPTPVRWSVVAGVLPTGMTGPNFQGSTAGNIIGTPSIAGTYRFTLQVSDQIGATDQETVTVVVA